MIPTEAVMALRPSIEYPTFTLLQKLTGGASSVGHNSHNSRESYIRSVLEKLPGFAHACRELVGSGLARWTDDGECLQIAYSGELLYTAYVRQLHLLAALEEE